jgi:hypothetical protein
MFYNIKWNALDNFSMKYTFYRYLWYKKFILYINSNDKTSIKFILAVILILSNIISLSQEFKTLKFYKEVDNL